jgi:hypothetical protein
MRKNPRRWRWSGRWREEKIESSQKGFMEIGGLIELTYKHFKSLAIALWRRL